MKLIQSKKIKDYKILLENLIDDFGYSYFHSILLWCKIISEPLPDKNIFWQVYIILNQKNTTIGLCGLYSMEPNNKNELWLGWFGILPKYRNKGAGIKALNLMEKIALDNGCSKLLSYVDQEGKPLNFYYRNGFKRLSSVKSYLKIHPNLSDQFESPKDHIIYKKLTSSK